MRDLSLDSELSANARSALQGRFSHVAVVIGVLVALIGGGHLLAWLTGVMAQLGLSSITMKTNAALGLFLAGSALAVVAAKAEAGMVWRGIAQLAAVILLALGPMTLLENLVGWDFGIDQFLAVERPGALAVNSPNRMGVPASLCLMLAGAALLTLSDRRGRGVRIAQALALGVCAISLLGVLGYLYQVRGLYALARWTGIAWPTAVGLFLLGLGLLFARPERGLMALVTADDPGGALLRRLLLPTICLLFTLGWLRLLGERRGLYEAAGGTAIVMLVFAAFFTGFVYFTARKMSQFKDVLREGEERLRLALDSANCGTFDFKPLTGELRWDAQMKQIWGLRPSEEPDYAHFFERIHAEDRERVSRIVAVSLAPKANGEYEADYRIVWPDGTIHWTSAEGRVYFQGRGEQRQAVRMIGVQRDITASKQAEEALRQSERRERERAKELATLLDAVPIPVIIVHDAEGTHMTGNRAADELLRSNRGTEVSLSANAETRPRHFKAVKDGRELSAHELPAQRAARGILVQDFDFSLVFDDGTIRHVLGYGTPLRDEQGQSRGAVHVLVDITERKHRELLDTAQFRINHLVHSTRSLPEIMRHALREAAVALKSETMAISLRQGSEWLVSYAHGLPEEIVGMHMKDQEAPHAVLAIRTGKPVAISDAFNDPRVNRERMMKWNVRAVMVIPLLNKGETIGVMFFNYHQSPRAFSRAEEDFGVQLATSLSLALENARLYDGLRRHSENLERTVQERTAKLQELIGDLEHFSYSLTHDLRAPLRSMSMFAQMSLEGECADCSHQTAKDHLQRIQKAAKRMDGLITDALQYTKAVRNDLTLEPVDVATLLGGILQSYPNLQPPQAEVRLDGEFPPVLGNEAALTQCFSNLLGNAVKFVAPGVVPKVRVWAQADTDYVRLWLEDNGIGIPKESQAHLFEMFFRATNTHEGSGIGLALVRKNVTKMGGGVGVESEPGKGSRFWLDLQPANHQLGPEQQE